MNYNIFLQKKFDEYLQDGLITDKVNHLSETMSLAFNLNYFIQDSIVASNVGAMDNKLDALATKLVSRLTKGITLLEEDRFQMHYDLKVGANYRPFTLMFSDGQVLTALVDNVKNPETKFNGKAKVRVEAWALNNKDVTELIYPNNDKDIDTSELSSRLAKVINMVHTQFVKKNGALTLDVSNVVFEMSVRESILNAKSFDEVSDAVIDSEYYEEESVVAMDRVILNIDQKYYADTV